MKILFWNSCGLGMSAKRVSVRNIIRKNDIEVCFLLETKRAMCCDGFIRMLWNNLSVKWSAVNSFNKSEEF